MVPQGFLVLLGKVGLRMVQIVWVVLYQGLDSIQGTIEEGVLFCMYHEEQDCLPAQVKPH